MTVRYLNEPTDSDLLALKLHHVQHCKTPNFVLSISWRLERPAGNKTLKQMASHRNPELTLHAPARFLSTRARGRRFKDENADGDFNLCLDVTLVYSTHGI